MGVAYSIMRNLTTSLLVICPWLPSKGLQQSMFHPTHPLVLKEVIESSGMARDEVSVQCTIALLSDAVRSVHTISVEKMFKDSGASLPLMPEIDCLQPRPTSEVYYLGAIFHDEGTIDGTYGVHDDIWLSKLGYSKDKDATDFSSRLWLVWGDQKTAEIIRSVKAEQGLARHPFDRRDWMLGPPAYFHILQSITYMIVRTHWSSPAGLYFKSNLAHDIGVWGRKGITRENVKFHIVEPLIKESWAARIIAFFYDELANRSYLQGLRRRDIDAEKAELYDTAIAGLSPDQYMDILEAIRCRVFTSASWNGRADPHGEFTTQCRFLQEIELFLLLRSAIKRGDVGLIRRLVTPLSVFFFGSEQHRYGYEMMHLRWLLSDKVCEPVLQRAILASGLVNLNGLRDTFTAVDLVLEHVNCSYKLDMRNHKNSTHDVKSTFGRLGLTSAYTTKLRALIESIFGEKTSNKHSWREI